MVYYIAFYNILAWEKCYLVVYIYIYIYISCLPVKRIMIVFLPIRLRLYLSYRMMQSMQELTRGGRGSSHSPVWQRTPLYPGWQLQTYPLTWSTHVPPFRQGLLEHSLISAIKDSRLWDGLDRAFGWYVYIIQWFHCKFNVTASFYVKGKTCDWLTCFTVFSLVTGCTATVILIFLIIWNASSFVLTRRAWTWCLLI